MPLSAVATSRACRAEFGPLEKDTKNFSRHLNLALWMNVTQR